MGKDFEQSSKAYYHNYIGKFSRHKFFEDGSNNYGTMHFLHSYNFKVASKSTKTVKIFFLKNFQYTVGINLSLLGWGRSSTLYIIIIYSCVQIDIYIYTCVCVGV